MGKDKRVRFTGTNYRGVIILFQGKMKFHRYYYSLINELGKSGFLVIKVPYRSKDLKSGIEKAEKTLNMQIKYVDVISHSNGDKALYKFLKTTNLHIKSLIISAPTRGKVVRREVPTLVLWGDKYKRETALTIFRKAKKLPNYHFIGYPNVHKYIFGGVGYSKYHDHYDKKNRKIFMDVDKYSFLEQDVLEDMYLFIREHKIKEKIAICSENYFPFNSGVNILSNVLKDELEKNGKKVYIVTLRLKGVDYTDYGQEKNVVVFHSFRLPGKQARKECLVYSIRHFHMTRFLRAYQFDYIQMQTEFTIGSAVLSLKKKDNIPVVYTAHTMWGDMFEKRLPKFIAKPFNWMMKKMLLTKPQKMADLMTVPTAKVKKYYMQEWGKKEPVVIIPGCVDGARFIMGEGDQEIFEKLKKSYRLEDKIVIGYIGRIAKEKNIQEILQYFEQIAPEIPNLVFFIVGDGPYYDEFCRKARNSEYSLRIIPIGGIPNKELKYYYRLFDVFCTASTFETQGLTYVESMWCNTPVLARQDDCLTDFMYNNENGMIYENYDEWKEHLYRIIKDKEFKKKICDNAFKTAETYSLDIWARRMYFLYTQAKLIRDNKITNINYEEFNALKTKKEN